MAKRKNNPTTNVSTTVANTTTTTKPYAGTTGGTYYSKPKPSLIPVMGWERPTDPYASSNLALDIMSYRRQYRSAGIAYFAETYLEPLLDDIVAKLKAENYIVQYKQQANDGHGYKNYLLTVEVPQVKVNRTLWVAHYDTVDRDIATSVTRYDPTLKKYVTSATSQTHKLRKSIDVVNGIAMLSAGDDSACLGADDGAGLAIMLSLLSKGVTGGYIFTTGEEVGGVGAEQVEKAYAKQMATNFDYAIEVDRRGVEDVVISQGVGDCASDEFGEWLCKELDMGHKTSLLGSYTDVATFADHISECVNIASGYVSAHSSSEEVLLPYLDQLCDRLEVIDWSKAPIKREAGDYGNLYYKYGYGSPTGYTSGSTAYSESYIEPPLTSAQQAMLAECMQDPTFVDELLAHFSVTQSDLDDVLINVYGFSLDEMCPSGEYTTDDKTVTTGGIH